MVKKIGEFVRMSTPLHLRNTPEHWRAATAENLSEIEAIANTYERDAEAVENDGDLTMRGRAKKMDKVGATALEALKQFETKRIAGIKAQMRTIETALFQTADYKRPTEPMQLLLHEGRAREIRDQLRALTPDERLLVYLNTTDPETADAIERAPMALVRADKNSVARLRPFVDPAKVSAARLERARTRNPEQASELEALTSLAEIYQLAVNQVRAAVVQQMSDNAKMAEAASTPPELVQPR